MNKFNVLISEDVSYHYIINAKDKNEAMDKAMNMHENTPKQQDSIDRCEIINVELIT